MDGLGSEGLFPLSLSAIGALASILLEGVE